MILMTPEEAAEEFGIARRTVCYWAHDGKITKHPRPPRPRGGSPGFWVERAQVRAMTAVMRHHGPATSSRTPQSPD